MEDFLKLYSRTIDSGEVTKQLDRIRQECTGLMTTENLKKIFSLIDLTTLNTTDTRGRVEEFCDKINGFNGKFPNMPNVAAICIYPSLVETARKNLDVEEVKIASVSAGFPSSQTFLAIKVVESRMAVEKGADEIDIVIPVGTFLEENYKEVFTEIGVIKQGVDKIHVKVILETGALPSLDHVRLASIISMEAGADFIKTSTGKLDPPATPEAVYVMADAIRDFYSRTNKKIGIKPAGGIVAPEDALLYYAIVKDILGNDWLTPELFRLGASRLANNLLSAIVKIESDREMTIEYF
ncbi:MAG: deoxyribose-phosphate aldolase [Bacteroidota bacterium]